MSLAEQTLQSPRIGSNKMNQKDLYKKFIAESIVQRRLQRIQLNEKGGGGEILPVPSEPVITKPGTFASNPGYSTDGGLSIGGGIAGMTDPSPITHYYGKGFDRRSTDKWYEWLQNYNKRNRHLANGYYG